MSSTSLERYFTLPRFKHKSLIHHVPGGSSIRLKDGHWQVHRPHGAHTLEIPAAGKTEPPKKMSFTSGAIVLARWPVPAGAIVTKVSTTWTVPPAPWTDSGQGVGLFPGISSNVVDPDPLIAGPHILQPVMAWREPSGSNYWSVFGMFAGTSASQPVIHTDAYRVDPGTDITGVITLTGISGSLIYYRCEFLGIPGTILDVVLPAPFEVLEELECYDITACTDYPGTDRTKMRSIVVTTQASTPSTLAWRTSVYTGDCSQNIAVVDNSATSGEIDFIYPHHGIASYDLRSTADRLFAFDYDSSGKPDYLVATRAGAKLAWVLRNDGMVAGSSQFGATYVSNVGLGGYDMASTADQAFAWDAMGTGKMDHIIACRPGAGTFALLEHSRGTFNIVSVSASGIGGIDFHNSLDRAVPIDIGSGFANRLFVYRPGSGLCRIMRWDSGSFKIDSVGTRGFGGYDLLSPADQAVAFDAFGSGAMTDLVLYRPGHGAAFVIPLVGSHTPFYAQGDPGGGLGPAADLSSAADRIIAFDYNGFGYMDHLIVYRPGAGYIRILRWTGTSFYAQVNSDSGIGNFDLRSPNDILIAFDYEKTGKRNYLLCYRPGAGDVVILKNSGGTFTPVYRGY